MKAGIIADVQLGNHRRFGGEMVASMNDRCRMILDVLRVAMDRADEERCTHLIVAGDLFDYARPEAPLIAEVQKTFEPFAEQMEIIVLRGNHDMQSTAEGDTALAPLRHVARIIERPEMFALGEGIEMLAVPFMPGPVKSWLPDTIRALVLASEGRADGSGTEAAPPAHAAPSARLLALHMGIRDEKTPPWLASSPGAVGVDELVALAREHHISAIAAGDWHSRKQWEMFLAEEKRAVHILQVGALVPTGWDNPGLTGYGTIAFWSGKKFEIEELPGPRFIKVRTQDERDAALKAAKKCILYVSHVAAPEEMTQETAFWQAAALRSDIRLGGSEVLPDDEVAKAEARHAAALARDSDTVQQALDAYIKVMPLEEGVRREAVLARAKGYLK